MGRGHSFIGTEAVAGGTLTQRHLRKRYARVYRNVYRDNGPEFDARDRAVAAWLWSGMQAVVAGKSVDRAWSDVAGLIVRIVPRRGDGIGQALRLTA